MPRNDDPKGFLHRLRLFAAAAIAAGMLSTGADAASTIDPTIPAANSPMSSAPIRANFQAAYNDITALQGAITVINSGTSGGIPYYSSATTLASSGVLTADRIVLGGGPGAAPTPLAAGTSVQVLHGNASGAPTWGAVALATDVSGTLPVANGGTGAVTLTGLVLGNGTSAMTAYAGATCTNQFIRVLTGAGAATCATVSLTADVSGILPGANGGTNNGFIDFTGPTTSLKTFTLPNASATILTSNAAVTVAQGGTGLTAGTSGGVPTYTASGTITSSAALGANLPVIGGGAGAVIATGTRSGNTTTFVTTTGAQTSGNCVSIDASGNHIAAGGACTTLTPGQIPGTATNDDASAGNVGEYPTPGTRASGSALGLTDGVVANVTSFSLTAGDWDVSGVVGFTGAGSTNVSGLYAAINTTSATLPTLGTAGAVTNSYGSGSTLFVTSVNPILPVGPVRISLAATTTVYLVAASYFTVSTLKAYGQITARRAR